MSSASSVNVNWFTSVMEPAQNARQVRELVHKSHEAALDGASFKAAGYCSVAWAAATFDTFAFAGKTLKDCVICVLEFDFAEAVECVKMDSLDALHSLKLVAFMPFCIFAGMFFPAQVFGRLDYPDLEAQGRRDFETRIRAEIERPLREEMQRVREEAQRALDSEVLSQNGRVDRLINENEQLRLQNAQYAVEKDQLIIERDGHKQGREEAVALLTQYRTTTAQLQSQVREHQEAQNSRITTLAESSNEIEKKYKNLIALNDRRDAFFHHIIYQEIIQSPVSLLGHFHLCNRNFSHCSSGHEFTIEDWNQIKTDWAHLENAERYKKIDFKAIENHHPLID